MGTKGRPQKTYTEEQKEEIKKAYKKGHNPIDRNGWRKVMPRSKHPNKASDEAIEAYKKNI